MQLTKDILFPAVDTIKECLSILIYALKDIQVRKNILNDKQFDHLFSVEEINKLVVSGVPFRDAYKIVGASINEGKFAPSHDLHHTHEGSINDPGTEEIRDMMKKVSSFISGN
jgi:argininosuccinate lyase